MRSGIVPRIVESWWAPGRVVRGLRGMPDRGLIAILMGAMLMFLVAQAPEHARAAHLDPSVPLQARMGGALLAVMFIMPLLAYGVALIVAVLSRVTGRPVSPPAPHERVAVGVPVGGGPLDRGLDLLPRLGPPALQRQRPEHLPPRLDQVQVRRGHRLEDELPPRVRQAE